MFKTQGIRASDKYYQNEDKRKEMEKALKNSGKKEADNLHNAYALR